ARACDDAGGRPETLVLDVADPDAGARAVTECLERFGRIDALVNNAGTSSVRSLDELTDAEWQEQWELNVMAPMRLIRAAAPEMARRQWGRIVNVSSSAGKRPSSLNIAYGVTKSAMLALSRSFAEQFAAAGVLINAVAPGPVAGDAWLAQGGLADQRAAAGDGGGARDEVLGALGRRLPLGRLGTNE